MDEKDLQIFLTLAETGNLTRTAEKLYLAQPTLSKRLQTWSPNWVPPCSCAASTA